MRTKLKGRSSEFDKHVGARLRLFRGSKNISQSELAGQIGVTFQQLQKYETGKNRISATKLYEISECLDVELNNFFEGYDKKADKRAKNKDDLSNDPDLAKLFYYFREIKSPQMKKNLLLMLKSFVEQD